MPDNLKNVLVIHANTFQAFGGWEGYIFIYASFLHAVAFGFISLTAKWKLKKTSS